MFILLGIDFFLFKMMLKMFNYCEEEPLFDILCFCVVYWKIYFCCQLVINQMLTKFLDNLRWRNQVWCW